MITQDRMIQMVDELERRVLEQDSSQTVRLQQAKGLHGDVYIVTIENATGSDVYEVDAALGTWIRRLM